MDLDDLLSAGRLSTVGHPHQANHPTIEGRFSAACTAYSYIHPDSGAFLLLARKTTAVSNLS